eukprot:TRINITY_DN614_c0_g1_i2.p1 TRINITY_DN614_c0_g1~~TRINITY_DN614_c0_g1_i2.p1  ORF type:complete len:196 (+),score=52.60 TRINITY_DN614_c0_g1_i2:93-680(+)
MEVLKILLVGRTGVQLSSLVIHHSPEKSPASAAKVSVHTFVHSANVKVVLMDVGHDETDDCEKVVAQTCRSAQGIVLVYEVGSVDSFQFVERIFPVVVANSKNATRYLFGLETDAKESTSSDEVKERVSRFVDINRDEVGVFQGDSLDRMVDKLVRELCSTAGEEHKTHIPKISTAQPMNKACHCGRGDSECLLQ